MSTKVTKKTWTKMLIKTLKKIAKDVKPGLRYKFTLISRHMK